jgi:hypothetical protein
MQCTSPSSPRDVSAGVYWLNHRCFILPLYVLHISSSPMIDSTLTTKHTNSYSLV